VSRTGLRHGERTVGPAAPKSALAVLPATRKISAPGAPAVAAWNASSFLYDHETPRRIATPAWTAYLKIAEGCDHPRWRPRAQPDRPGHEPLRARPGRFEWTGRPAETARSDRVDPLDSRALPLSQHGDA
jgi:hypothetical protein